ncbi:High osmolarity sensitivity protein 3 [Apiospora marii]|uniref:High osmolarity sensitivity protein 3 n=1 Tax=Apiospora marii TaxID=335849 RepID=A0ABR1T1Z2_9PEZI
MASRNFNNTGSGMTTRPSIAPQSSGNAVKARQLLEQLSSNLADTENLLRMTAVQAEAMRGLGSWHGGMFMAASKVLGEESVKDSPQQK